MDERPGLPLAVVRLRAADRAAVARHLLALDGDDRYSRFGAAIRDEGIRRHVAGLDFERDLLLGLGAAEGLVGLAHVGCGGGDLAELALSVARPWRRLGLARTLFGLAVPGASRRGMAGFACIHGHAATLRIARSLGLAVRLQGGDPRAVLAFPRRVA